MLINRLWGFQLPEKAFPYYRGCASANEATLMALLAFFAAGVPLEKTKPVLSGILSQQNADGSIGANNRCRGDGIWLTAHLAIVLLYYGYAQQMGHALGFLRSLKSHTSATAAHDGVLLDDQIVGWPWVRNTFGWVEPTAWALIAFTLSGQENDPRAINGRKLLLDRQIASGGWNYGNKEVKGAQLIPFWDTTSLALLALHGSLESAAADISMQAMVKALPSINSLYGLALTTVCLEAYNRDASFARDRLCALMSETADEELNVAHYALGVIALMGRKVFST